MRRFGGPGHLHLLNGLYDANRARAPVFALASTIPSAEVGGSYFQEPDPGTVFESCSGYNATCSTREQVPRVFEMAFQHAIGRQGVAVVALAGDTAEEDPGLGALAPHRFELGAPTSFPPMVTSTPSPRRSIATARSRSIAAPGPATPMPRCSSCWASPRAHASS